MFFSPNYNSLLTLFVPQIRLPLFRLSTFPFVSRIPSRQLSLLFLLFLASPFFLDTLYFSDRLLFPILFFFFSFSTPGQPAIPSFDIDSFVPFPSRRILLLFFRRRGQILRPKWLQGIGRSFERRVSEERQPLSINEYIVRAASFVIRLSIKDNGNRAKGRPTDSAFPVDAVKPATCRCNVLAKDRRVGFPVRPLANTRAR